MYSPAHSPNKILGGDSNREVTRRLALRASSTSPERGRARTRPSSARRRHEVMDLLLLWAMLAVASAAVCAVLETTLSLVPVSALGAHKAVVSATDDGDCVRADGARGLAFIPAATT